MFRQFKNMRWTNLLTFLFFVALAAAIWYGHAMNSVRNTQVPVLVSYTGAPATIGFGGQGLPDTVYIEVRDAGSRLMSYVREPLRLTVDLHSYIHGDKGTIHIPSDALRRSLSDILQGTSRLIATTPEEISCPYFTEREKTVSVLIAGELTPAAEYQLVGEPILSPAQVRIFGSSTQLETIDSIFTEPLALTELSDTTDLRVALDVPRRLRCERDSVDLRIITERFTEKKVTVPLHALGVPDGYRIRLFPREVEVTLRVGMSHFAQVDAGDVRAVCRYSSERKDKLDVELQYTNPYITAAWVYPGIVEFILEQ